MEGKGQLCINVSVFLTRSVHSEPLSCAPEPGAEGQLLIGISQCMEQAADLVGARACVLDHAQGGGRLSLARLDTLEECAIERAAVAGSVRVNAAVATVKRGARLRHMRRAMGKVRDANRNSGRPQSRGVVVGPQRDVGKNDATAAEPAGGTKLVFNRGP